LKISALDGVPTPIFVFVHDTSVEEFHAKWTDTKSVPARLAAFLQERVAVEFKHAEKLGAEKRKLDAEAADAKKSRLIADELVGKAVLEDERRKANNVSSLERASALTQDLVNARASTGPTVKAPPQLIPKSKAPRSGSPNAAPYPKRTCLPTPIAKAMQGAPPTTAAPPVGFGMSSATVAGGDSVRADPGLSWRPSYNAEAGDRYHASPEDLSAQPRYQEGMRVPFLNINNDDRSDHGLAITVLENGLRPKAETGGTITLLTFPKRKPSLQV
jgi:hypothetical protein